MERITPRTDLDAARKSIDEALKHLYISRVLLRKQSDQWPTKLKEMEVMLFGLIDEIEFHESGGRCSSWSARR